MADRYKTMIPAGFTTLWEHYDRWWATRLNAFDAGSSLNHGWNPPVINLSQSIAGVAPETPGWSTFHVLPKEAFLTSLKVVVPSIEGPVTVTMKKTASEYALGVVSPPGTQAIVGIPKGSFSKLARISVNGATIWDGAFDAGPQGLSWNGEDEDYIKFNAGPGTWTFSAYGSLPLARPKPLPAPPSNDVPLGKKTWTASASVADGTFSFTDDKIPIDVSAANAIDGDHWTGWRDLTGTQHPGQWFQIDMQRQETFHKLVLDTTWALWDSPKTYAVSASRDGVNWGKPIATGQGQMGITTIVFPTQNARFIRITQTGSDATYNWSVYEVDVYRKKAK